MTIDINKLRRLAQAATPGPWMLRTAPTSAGLCHIISAADWRGAFIYGDGLRIGVDDALPKAQELAANARLIAAANPAAISELLDRVEAVEKERDALRAEVIHIKEVEFPRKAQAVADGWRGKCERLEAKIEAMEQQEPVAFALCSGWAVKAVYHKEHEACDQRDRRQLSADLGGSLEAYRVVPLYTLPDAKGEEE